MARHRNIRSMNFDEEYDDYYNNQSYGHSVDDEYCISPHTEAQFMYKRNNEKSNLQRNASNMHDPIEEEQMDDEETLLMKRESLSPIERAQLDSCVEELQNVIGDTLPDSMLINAAIKHNYDIETALNSLLNKSSTSVDIVMKDNKEKSAINESSVSENKNEAENSNKVKIDENLHLITNSMGRFAFGVKSDSAEQVKLKNGKEKSPKKIFPNKQQQDQMAKENNEPIVNTVVSKQVKVKENELILNEYKNDLAKKKPLLNMVVIGHVDAGKSTLMGHLLCKLDLVSKKSMHRYETDSKKLGKASFLYAWVLDETDEERSRGITMDIAQSRFETDKRSVILLDAPGHKDFIPNMITGAAQADVALLVVDATKGEFEAGFEAGGQTQEHTLLVRSLGVTQLSVVVNKLDNIDWSEERFNEIIHKLSTFLKQAGFKEQDTFYVPCSGLTGENLVTRSKLPQLTKWYKGPCLLEIIDNMTPPERLVEKPLRLCVNDIYKGVGSSHLSLSGRIEAGYVKNGQKIIIMPFAENCVIKSVNVDEDSPPLAYAGESVSLTLMNCDPNNITVGSIICDPSHPIPVTNTFQARVVIFHNAQVPLTKGFPVVIHHKSLSEQATVRKLISQLNKSTGELMKKNPRCLVKNTTGVIELIVNKPICLELYKDYKELGRFMLRSKGSTIAAGMVTKIL